MYVAGIRQLLVAVKRETLTWRVITNLKEMDVAVDRDREDRHARDDVREHVAQELAAVDRDVRRVRAAVAVAFGARAEQHGREHDARDEVRRAEQLAEHELEIVRALDAGERREDVRRAVAQREQRDARDLGLLSRGAAAGPANDDARARRRRRDSAHRRLSPSGA